MKVVLLERVERLGAIGDVVQVKDGFARNFLLPQAEGAARHYLQPQGVRGRARPDRGPQRRSPCGGRNATAPSSKGETYVLIRQAGEGGQLYGSVSGRDVAEVIVETGARVERSQVVLDRPIKTVGVHEVKLRLHPEVTVTVRINIARSPTKRTARPAARTSLPRPSTRTAWTPRPRPRTCSRAAPVRRCGMPPSSAEVGLSGREKGAARGSLFRCEGCSLAKRHDDDNPQTADERG